MQEAKTSLQKVGHTLNGVGGAGVVVAVVSCSRLDKCEHLPRHLIPSHLA